MGLFSPHLFLAEMVTVKVVLRRTLLGFSTTVITVLLLPPLTVIAICCTPGETLVSIDISNSSVGTFTACGCYLLYTRC